VQTEVVRPAVLTEPAVRASVPLTCQAILFILWLIGILVFSVLLIQRVFFVRGLIAQCEPAKDRLVDILNQCRRQIGISRGVGLKLSPSIQSPAVCGLLRPTVLMPKALFEKLSPEKLRAVLIHELAHIKRGDLWINLAQTLLQIVYFYNPFVWLTNVIVRRIREQAVDEMVLVALGAEAKSYSNTLIDIAEMAFWKANFSLRLIGVVESKKALHRRIKHMLTRPIPKSAKLGVAGAFAVIIVGALLLPMAGAATKEQEKMQFMAALPNSVTVELIGVCEHPSEGKQWWRPDGVEIEKPEFNANKPPHEWRPASPNGLQFECAALFKFSNFSGKNVSILEVRFSNKYLADGIKSRIAVDGTQITYIVYPPNGGAFPKVPNKVDISLAIGTSPFKKAIRLSGKFNEKMHEVYTLEGNSVLIRHPLRIDHYFGTPAVDLTCLEGDFEYRVIGELKNGQTEQWSGGSIGKEVRFFHAPPRRENIELEDFKQLIIEYRPYEWVTFRNVSLQSGLETDTQVVVETESTENIAPAAIVGTWFFDNPSGDEERMAVFPDGRVVVLYSNGHVDKTNCIDGFIELAEYNNARCKMIVLDDNTLLQYFNYPDTESGTKYWHRINPEPRTNLLRPLTGPDGGQSESGLSKQIDIVTDILIQAFNAGDIDATLSYYTDDAISLPDQHEAAIGKGALHKLFMTEAEKQVKLRSIKVKEQQVWICGEMIYEAGKYTISFTAPGTRFLFTDYRKSLTVYERQPDGSLKIKLDSWNPDVIPTANVTANLADPIVTAIACGTSAVDTTESNMEAVYDQIKQKELTFHKAFIEHNAEAAAQFYANDAIIMSWGKNAVRGKADIFSDIKKSMSVEPLVDMTQHVVHIEGNDQMLFVVNLFSWKFKDKSSGENVTLPGKGVHVWKRQQDSSWKILLDLYNVSVPLPEK